MPWVAIGVTCSTCLVYLQLREMYDAVPTSQMKKLMLPGGTQGLPYRQVFAARKWGQGSQRRDAGGSRHNSIKVRQAQRLVRSPVRQEGKETGS